MFSKPTKTRRISQGLLHIVCACHAQIQKIALGRPSSALERVTDLRERYGENSLEYVESSKTLESREHMFH